MFCNCFCFETKVFFFVHMVYVCDYNICMASDKVFSGFTNIDIAVGWTSAYMHFEYKTNTPKIIWQILNVLACNNIEGPTMKNKICKSIEIEEKSPKLTAKKCLKNYRLIDILIDDNKPFDGMGTTFIEP